MTLLELCKRCGFEGIKKITKAEQAPSQHRDKAQHLLDIFDICYYDEAADILGSEHSLSLRIAEYYLSLVESGESLSLGEKELSVMLLEDSVFRETLVDYLEHATAVISYFLRNNEDEEEAEDSDNPIEGSHQPHLPPFNELFDKEYEETLRLWEGKEKIMSLFRQDLVPNTPEEKVRHAFEHIIKHHVLKDYEETEGIAQSEVHLAHFGVTKEQRRVDLILYQQGDNEGDKPEPLILFEFKEPSAPLDDDTKAQLDNYEKLLNEKSIHPLYMILSNGKSHLVRSSADRAYKTLSALGEYLEIMQSKGVKGEPIEESDIPKEAAKYDWCAIRCYEQFYADGNLFLGVGDSLYDDELWEKRADLFIHFHYFLRYYTRTPEEIQNFERASGDLTIGGVMQLSFGDQSSGENGKFTGHFRVFHYKGQRFALGIHPWMQPGQPYLLVAIGKARRLQLNMEEFFLPWGSRRCLVVHDGRINASGGRTKQKVLDKSSEFLPAMEGRVVLGSFISQKGLSLADEEFRSFLVNIFEYALLREDLKEEMPSKSPEKWKQKILWKDYNFKMQLRP